MFRIPTDPHKEMPPGSGSAWTDTDPDQGKKSLENIQVYNWKQKSKASFYFFILKVQF